MNYYEILGLDIHANSSAIETALDTRYDQWRALVTNHDPKVVSEANQALMTIEDIRKTLLDSSKRNEYDRALKSIGGLEDLSLGSSTTGVGSGFMAPPRPRPVGQTGLQGETEDVNIWNCPSCKKKYPAGTRFCKACGSQMGVECPDCGKLTYVSSKYCIDCGIEINEAQRRKELLEIERQKEYRRQSLLEPIRKKATVAKQFSSMWWWIHPGLGLFIWAIGLYNANSGLKLPPVMGDEQYRQVLINVKKKTALSLGVILVFIVLALIIGLIGSIFSAIGSL